MSPTRQLGVSLLLHLPPLVPYSESAASSDGPVLVSVLESSHSEEDGTEKKQVPRRSARLGAPTALPGITQVYAVVSREVGRHCLAKPAKEFTIRLSGGAGRRGKASHYPTARFPSTLKGIESKQLGDSAWPVEAATHPDRSKSSLHVRHLA